MKSYIQLTFQDISPEQSDLLMAELAVNGFEGFEEKENTLKAFIPSTDFDEEAATDISAKYDITFIKTIVEEQNWNADWESSFQPVVVDDFVAIRADFHEPVAGVEQEIIITPKMSFGTGHHATTYMMVQQMREIDFKNKTVFDFGTGTGILSILAEKLGASKIIAVDYDEWSIENTGENLERNQSSKIELRKSDNAGAGEQYDIILANINKNVILENFSSLVSQLSPNGILLLSGLLGTDEKNILSAAANFPLVSSAKTTRNNWIALRFSH